MATWMIPIRLVYPLIGQPGVNVWHARTTGDFPSESELDGLADLLLDFYNGINGLFPDSYSAHFDGVATTVEAEPQVQSDFTPWTAPGTAGSGGYLPTAAQICVTLRTSSASRSGRGRKFLGPISSVNLQSDGTPSAAALVLVSNAMNALVSASTGFTNGAIGVYSPTDALFRDLTGFSVADQFAVLRSRRD